MQIAAASKTSLKKKVHNRDSLGSRRGTEDKRTRQEEDREQKRVDEVSDSSEVSLPDSGA